MLEKRFSVFLLSLFTLFNLSLSNAFAESNLDFEIVPMHYGLLNAEPLTDGENEGLISYTVQTAAAKGDNQLMYDPGSFHLSASELFVYVTTSGTYHIGQVKAVSGNTLQFLELMKPLEGDVNAGNNVWNFYKDTSHPNKPGYKALVDEALKQLSSEDFENKVHAFIGDSWFDNSTMVPYFDNKLNAAEVINKGIGGRKTIDVLENFDEEFPSSAAVQPDYFWILLGTNDYWNEVPRDVYINNLTNIIQKVNDLGAKAMVFTSSVAPFLDNGNDFYNKLSHHYADDLLALKQTGGSEGISALTQGDNLVIEFTPTSPINSDSHILYLIDTDNNSATGYQNSSLWTNAGPDYLIQDNFIYRSTGTNWDWADQQVAATSTSPNKIVLAKNDIGLADSPQNTIINIGVMIVSNDWSTTEAYYPVSGKMQKVTINKSTTNQFEIVPDTANTTDGTEVTIDVLANDTGTGLIIDNVDTPDNGSVSIASNKLLYQPNTGFIGTEVFRYRAVDASGNNSAWANVTITISALDNAGPKANEDSATVTAGETVYIDALANDTGNGLEIVQVNDTWTGSISIVGGKLKYQSDDNYTGELIVWYGIKDSQGRIDGANVTITITEKESTPFKANNDTATVTAGETVFIDALANDTGNGLEIVQVNNTWTGSISIVSGKLKYQSDGNYTGELIVWYGIKDSQGRIDGANVTITITEKESTAFKANKDTATVKSGEMILIDVLANDTGNNLVLECVDDAWTGTSSQVGNKLKYQSGSYIGDVKVWYDVSDSDGNYGWASVTITITE